MLKSEKAPTSGDLRCNRKRLECLEGVMLRLEAEADWLIPCPARGLLRGCQKLTGSENKQVEAWQGRAICFRVNRPFPQDSGSPTQQLPAQPPNPPKGWLLTS